MAKVFGKTVQDSYVFATLFPVKQIWNFLYLIKGVLKRTFISGGDSPHQNEQITSY